MFPWEKPDVAHPGFVDMTGKQAGCMQVVTRAPNNRHGTAQWNCRCNVCGTESVWTGIALRSKPPENCRTCRRPDVRRR